MDQIVLLIMLAALAAVLTASQYFGGSDSGDESDEEAERDPVARHLRVANYGSSEAAENSRRQLLAVGPSVAPALVDRVLAVANAPATLHPRAQRFLEDVLTDFGAAGYVAVRHRLDAVDTFHPAAPAIVRVLVAAGAPALEQVVREGDVSRFRFLLPAAVRLDEHGLSELIHTLPHFAADLQQALADSVIGSLAHHKGAVAFDSLPAPLLLHGAEVAWPGARSFAEAAQARSIALPVQAMIDAQRRNSSGDAERTEGPGLAAAVALVALAVADPERAAPVFARRMRAGSWPRDGEVALCACVRLLGARAERVVVEQLRHGRDQASELACVAMAEVEATRHALPLFAVVARPRTDRCALAALNALLRAGRALGALAVEALDDGDVDVRMGAAWIAGVIGESTAVEILARRASMRLGDRAAMLQAIERIGAAAAAPVARAVSAGHLQREDADASRVIEMVTLLASTSGAEG